MGDIRAEKNGYDDAYIDAFLTNPKSKTKAMLAAGYTGEGLSQMAWRTHNRLRIRINEEFEKRKSDYAMVGHALILEVADDKDATNGEKLSAGKSLLDYGGHKPGETIDVNVKIDSMSDSQMNNRIEEIERQIAEGEGRIIDAEVEVIDETPAKNVLPVTMAADVPVDPEDQYNIDDEEDFNEIGEWQDDD